MRKPIRSRYSHVDGGNAVDWDHPLNRGKVAWYLTPPGVAAAGSRLLDLCGRNHGTLTNMSIGSPTSGWQSAGQSVSGVSSPLAFDGTDDYVTFGNASSLNMGTKDFTLSAWINIASGYGIVLSKTKLGAAFGRYVLYVNTGTGKLSIFLSADGGSDINGEIGTTNIFGTGWRHASWVLRRDANCTVYLDGKQNGTLSISSAFKSSSNYTNVLHALSGAQGNSTGLGDSTLFLSGRLDDISVYNRALSAAEVAELYRLGRAGYRTPDSPLRWISTRSWYVPSTGSRRRRLICGAA